MEYDIISTVRLSKSISYYILSAVETAAIEHITNSLLLGLLHDALLFYVHVMSGRSFNLTTLFLGRLRPLKAVNQYFVHILSPNWDFVKSLKLP